MIICYILNIICYIINITPNDDNDDDESKNRTDAFSDNKTIISIWNNSFDKKNYIQYHNSVITIGYKGLNHILVCNFADI